MECFRCGKGAPDELTCKACSCSAHFTCAFGAQVTLQKNKTLFKKNFICAVCVVASSNKLTLDAVSKNQTYNAAKSDTHSDFVLPDSFFVAQPNEEKDTSVVSEPDTSSDANNPDNTADNAAPEVVTAAITPAAGPNANVAAVTPVAPAHDTAQPSQNVTAEDARDTLPPSLARENLTPLHPHDESRAKKFSYLLNSFYRLPGHPNTFIGGDSHLTKLNGKEVDPDDDQVRVRSAGGLCIPALVHALARHKRVYKRFKSVSWNIGTNDALHGDEQHCPGDRDKYLRLLYSESRRIFPGAKIHVILPFSGLRGVSQSFIDTLERDLKSACPDVVVLKPPSMQNKIGRSGIHVNRSGRAAFIKFLRATLVKRKQRVFSSDSGRLRSNTASQGANTGFRVPNQLAAPPHSGVPSQTGDAGLVNDIATKVMELISQQNLLSRYYPPLPAWPPAPLR